MSPPWRMSARARAREADARRCRSLPFSSFPSAAVALALTFRAGDSPARPRGAGAVRVVRGDRRHAAQRDRLPHRQHDRLDRHDQARARREGRDRASRVIGALAYRGCHGCVADSAVPPHVTPPRPTCARRALLARREPAAQARRAAHAPALGDASRATGSVHVPPLRIDVDTGSGSRTIETRARAPRSAPARAAEPYSPRSLL